MLEKNKADSRKYFIFKIRDLVHNSFHTLEEKRTESLLQYMGICISTYDELRASLDPTKLSSLEQVFSSTCATAAMEAKASPRKPMV